jgi:Bacterial pre-peptidase C-terminal domain
MDGFFYRTRNAQGWSNGVTVNYAHGALVLENQAHDSMEKAQVVTLPCEVIGRIERRNDRDWYSFTAKAGEVITLEGFAERIGVPLDLYLELRGEKGNLIGEYDDHPDVGNYHRFACRTDDPSTRVTIPADGKYFLMVSSRDATLRSDPRLQYRVSVHKPRPDFRMVAIDAHPQNPGSLRLVPGSRQHLDLVLFRREGFTGPVTCTVEGLPAGITCTSMTVPTGAITGALLFNAADKVAEWNGTIRIVAQATIDGAVVKREVRAGCLTWPNPNEPGNGPAISRLCRTMAMAVRPGTLSLRISLPATPLALPIGGNTNVKLKIERLTAEAKVPVTVTSVHLPPGVIFNNNQPLVIPADKAEIEAKVQVQPAAVADQFPLLLRAAAQVPFAKDPSAKQKPAISVAETSAAVPVTIYRQVLTVVDGLKKLDVAQGKESALAIKFERLHSYQGPVTVQVQGLPAGVTIASATIPEKVSEAKWVVKAAKNAAIKDGTPVTLRLTGAVNGINLMTEHKLVVNVVK